MDINEKINSYRRNDYQRENFDSFLNKVSFSYSIPSIHIGGTNGKGSTATYLAAILEASGYKAGLFTSPCYKSLSEMIKINKKAIFDEEITQIFDKYHKLFDKFQLSSFEIITFIAFTYFSEQKVDVAIIECGMGGEVDATNIFTPILSIITNISMEHTDFLGVSLSEIALHKAGIIKDNVPVLIGDMEEDALNVVASAAKRHNSKIFRISTAHKEALNEDDQSFDYGVYKDLHIRSLSKTNIKDACLAIEAANIIGDSFKTNEKSIKEGLMVNLPNGRFKVFKDKKIIVDGAHNPDAIVKLRNDVDNLGLNANIRVVFACFRDKNITSMLPEISLLGDIFLTTFDHQRARKEFDYFLYLEEYKYFDDHISLIKDIRTNYPDDYILVTGSLAFAYLVCDEIENEII